jgi:uncharacterized membrane protein (UPF0127 family)
MTGYARIRNLDRESYEPVQISLCDTLLTRFRGLMGRKALHRDEGVLLVGDRDSRVDAAIHMLFVPFDLAVFWINTDLFVVDKIVARSWRPAYVPRTAARYVLELHPDHFPAYDIGNRVKIVNA